MININRKKVLLILNWCQTKFGKSKHRKTYPILRVYKSSGTSFLRKGTCGTYCAGNLHIFLGANKSIRELCETIVHEYKHYLMNHNEYSKIEHKLRKLGFKEDYILYKHPYEKICIRFEKKWGPVCYKELKNKLYKN